MSNLLLISSLLSIGSLYAHELKNKSLSGIAGTPNYKVQGPLVSVVIPALQEEDYIEFLLFSIENQTYEPIEVVIAESSNPESKELTKKIAFEWGAKVIDVPFGNVCLSRNKGALETSGETIVFVDADCILASDFIEVITSDLDRGIILSHGIKCYYDSDFRNIPISMLNWVKPDSWVSGSGIAMRKVDFLAVGGFDEECNPAEVGRSEGRDLGRRVTNYFGSGSVILNKRAILAEAARRPLRFSPRLWPERGWRKGEAIERIRMRLAL